MCDCNICDKIIKRKSKNKHIKSITHNELENSIQTTHSIEYPKFFDVDDMYKDFIKNSQ